MKSHLSLQTEKEPAAIADAPVVARITHVEQNGAGVAHTHQEAADSKLPSQEAAEQKTRGDAVKRRRKQDVAANNS